MGHFKLPLLRSDESNLCQGCPSSCCSPVRIILESSYPLNADDPRQTNENFQLIRNLQQRTLDYINRMIELGVPNSVDNRFSVRGFYAFTNPTNPIDQFVTSDGSSLMAWNITVCVLYNCDAFDERNRICTRYETRPPMCRNYSTDRCGMDTLSRAIYTADTSEGQLRASTIRFHQRIDAEAKPTFEAALSDFFERNSCRESLKHWQ